MADRLHAASQKRNKVRPQLISGKNINYPDRDVSVEWLKEKWPELLDAHYQCRIPGPSASLQDALHMITEPHSVQITCLGAKKKKEDEHKEGDEQKEDFAVLRFALSCWDLTFRCS